MVLGGGQIALFGSPVERAVRNHALPRRGIRPNDQVETVEVTGASRRERGEAQIESGIGLFISLSLFAVVLETALPHVRLVRGGVEDLTGFAHGHEGICG